MIDAAEFLGRFGVDDASEDPDRLGRGSDARRGIRPSAMRAVASGNADAVDDAGRDLDACREAALRLLDAAPRASGALRERLIAKGYADGIVDEVIQRLSRVHLLDDRSYAESAVRYCTGRCMGRRGTVMELIRKGVDRGLAETVAAEAERRGDFEEAAWELGRRYARKTRGLDAAVRRRRFWSAGGRKGHSPETLRRIAETLLS